MQPQESPEQTTPGNLLQVAGVGILLLGKSGAGKSDATLELLRRGHSLVADDSVILKREQDQLIGYCPPAGQGFLFVHEIGLIDIAKIFGPQAFLNSQQLDIVIQLSRENTTHFPQTVQETSLMQLTFPCYFLNTFSYRPIATLIETIAHCFLLEKKGYNALTEFRKRQRTLMDRS